MRIAMLSAHTCPLATLGGKKTGGMNVYVRDLSKELGKRGITVDIYTRLQDTCHAHLGDSFINDHARVIHIPAGPEHHLSSIETYDYMPTFADGILARDHNEYDLIHSHYWLSGWVAEKLQAMWGIPLMQMFHTLGLMKNRIATEPSQQVDPLRVEVEPAIIQQSDVLVAATPAERIQLMWLYGADMKKIEVISPGVDLSRFQPIPRFEAKAAVNLNKDTNMLLFVGRPEPLKGLDTLVHALAQLADSAPHLAEDIYLAVIGGEPTEDEEIQQMRRLAEQLGLSDHIDFLGAKNQDTLQYYYSAAEAVIMPSNYESFGMVAIEAMACGTPVIASEVGGLAYLVQDGVTGFHVPYRDPDELAGKIGLILENTELRDEMAQAAISYVKKYSWANIADQITTLYDKLAT